MRLAILAAVAVGAVPLLAQGPLSEADVEAAIAAGSEQKMFGTVVVGNSGPGQFGVIITGPLGTISNAAAAAQKRYEPFGLTDVTEGMREPVLTVRALPNAPGRIGQTMTVTPPADRVVLQPHGGKEAATAVHALQTETFEAKWGNAAGAVFSSQGVLATFSMADVPADGFDVVVLTRGGERRYTVKAEQQADVR